MSAVSECMDVWLEFLDGFCDILVEFQIILDEYT